MNINNIKKIILLYFYIGLATPLQSCTSSNIKMNSYSAPSIKSSLQKSYNLSRGDIIAAYDLVKMNHNINCIYYDDLSLIVNDKYYTVRYIQQFKERFKSVDLIKKEAQNKIIRMCKLLLTLNKKYSILLNSQLQYVKKVSKIDMNNVNLKNTLSNLDNILQHIPVMIPIYKPQISSPYGMRKHPIKKKRSLHCGIDLVGVKSAPIYASAKGVIVFVGKKNGYGNIIEIQHNNKIQTVYAHLSTIKVNKGQLVERGCIIGCQGNTGHTTKEHLHFEVRVNNKHVNPIDFIAQSYKCR